MPRTLLRPAAAMASFCAALMSELLMTPPPSRWLRRQFPGPGQGGGVGDGAELGTGRRDHRRVDGEREPPDDDRQHRGNDDDRRPFEAPDRRGGTRAIVIYSPLASHSRFMVAEALMCAVLR